MRIALSLALCALLSSCATGLIYSHTTRPLVTDLRGTPLGDVTASQNVKHFRYQNFDFQWSSNAIGDIAKNHGIQEVYYADLETLSILGIWSQYHVHVYGR